MIRDITLGQYYPTGSLIHRLDPRVKLLGTLIYIVSLFLAKNLIGYFLAIVLLSFVIRTSKVPLSYIMKGLKPVIVLLLFSVVLNLFLTTGDHVILKIWFLTLTLEGLLKAIVMAVRLVFLVIGSALMTYTTTPNELTDGLEVGLGWMKKLHVPVHEIAMMMSIALRFIPILVEETDKIMKAQMARGADFETGSILQRAKAMIPLLVPLFISAFRRATDLAMAMEARCYHGGEGRTRMKPLHYEKKDHIAYAVLALYLILMIAVSFVTPIFLNI